MYYVHVVGNILPLKLQVYKNFSIPTLVQVNPDPDSPRETFI